MATEKPKSLYDRVNERWLDLAFDRIFSTDEALEDAVVNEFREVQPGVSERELREMVRRAAAIAVEGILELKIEMTLQDGSHMELEVDPETYKFVEKKPG